MPDDVNAPKHTEKPKAIETQAHTNHADAHDKLEREALVELKNRTMAVDEEVSRKQFDEMRRALGLPANTPDYELPMFFGKQTLDKDKIKMGLPVWSTGTQLQFYYEADSLKHARLAFQIPPDTTDERVRDKVVEKRRRESSKGEESILEQMTGGFSRRTTPQYTFAEELAQDKRRLHLPTSADPLSVLKAIKAQDARIERQQFGLAPGPPLNVDQYQAAQGQCELHAQTEIARAKLHLPASDRNVLKIDGQWHAFEDKYNVQVVHVSETHKLIYSSSPNVRAEQLVGEINSVDPLSAANKQVRTWIDNKEKALSQNYGCIFTPENQRVHDYLGARRQSLNSSKQEQQLVSAEPTVTELIGLESAMKRLHVDGVNQPNHTLQVTFLDTSSGKDSAYYVPGKDAIYFEKDCAHVPATQEELSQANHFPRNPWTVESIATHELGHSTQDQQHWFGVNAAASSAKGALHWVCLQPGSILDDAWYLQGKDGNLYQHSAVTGHWLKFNAQGQMLDNSNKLARSPRDAAFLTNDQMAMVAVEKPCTDYFDHPDEMDAEGITLLRLGGSYRKELLKRNPHLYYVVKRQDQESIDSTYGVSPNKQPLYVRDLDGMIRKSTPAILGRISSFEQRIVEQPQQAAHHQ